MVNIVRSFCEAAAALVLICSRSSVDIWHSTPNTFKEIYPGHINIYIYTLAAACNGNTHPDRTVCIKHATSKAKNDMSGRIRKAPILQNKKQLLPCSLLQLTTPTMSKSQEPCAHDAHARTHAYPNTYLCAFTQAPNELSRKAGSEACPSQQPWL